MPEPREPATACISERIRLLMKLRQSGITDARVLGAMEQVPRELFVPESFVHRAYEDTALPIAHGQTISQPSVVAWMTQALKLGERMRVLEIGTGSGYQAAILAKLCRMTYTIERVRGLHEEACKRFKAMRIANIVADLGDGYAGWPHAAPFDRIMMTAAPEEVPQTLLDQLAVGGIMIAPVGEESGGQYLQRICRDAHGYTTETLMDVRFVPMVAGRQEAMLV